MYSWRVTEPGDVESLRIHRWDEYGIAIQSTLSDRLDEMVFKYTLLHDEKPYAVVIGYWVSEGVCELIMVSDISIAQHAKAFYETATHLMDHAAPLVRRWQVHVDVGNDVSASMNEKLGMTLEALVEGYFPDCDAYLYGKVNR